jgi:heme-degrading monooxygenase HmoA
MILEAALLNIGRGQDAAFAATMEKARPLIAATSGFLGIEVRPCLEHSGQYLLLVWWERSKIIPRAFVLPSDIRSGKNSCISSMTPFLT